MRAHPFIYPATLCTLVACAQPNVASFGQSAAFQKLGSTALALVERDFDGDGLPDAVIARRTPSGFEATILIQDASAAGSTWREACSSPPTVGDDLDHLTTVGPPGEELVLLVAVREDPDELRQSAQLVDPRAGCATRWQGDLRWPKVDGLVASQAALFGVRVTPDGRSVRYIEHPVFARLRDVGIVVQRYDEQIGQVVAGTIEMRPHRVELTPTDARKCLTSTSME